MHETCRDCGKRWGVTETPRADIQCSDCARPKPWYRADAYWAHRARMFLAPYFIAGSAEWWDQQTSLADLRIAAELAHTLEA